MTYGELKWALEALLPEQLDTTLTVEDAVAEQCYPAELRICNDTHHSLDDDHPVIFFE